MALHDHIWKEDIIDEQDYLRSLTLVLVDWAERLRFQKAPPELIRRIEALRDTGSLMYDELESLKVCFPKEP